MTTTESAIREAYRMDKVLFVNNDGSTFWVKGSSLRGFDDHYVPPPPPVNSAYAQEAGRAAAREMPLPRRFRPTSLHSKYMDVLVYVEG